MSFDDSFRASVPSKPLVMGILNVTPDSFSDGGTLYGSEGVNLEKALEKGLKMVREGADIVDIGGESSGPGSKDVSLEEELERVIPIVRRIRERSSVPISVDTWKTEVARQALEAGANMINDVTAFRGDSSMLSMLAKSDVPVIFMYAKDPTARTTKEALQYADVVQTIMEFLEERIACAEQAGIARERLIVDPGMGAFISADPKYSLEVLRRLSEFQALGLPVLVGASRKGFIGEVLALQGKPLPVDQRLEGSLACALVAMKNGASILRVHDVQETRRIVDMGFRLWHDEALDRGTML